jgi:hypothetical protein
MVINACGLQKSFHKNSKHKQTDISNNHLSYIRMHRTACFGRCPVYSIEIFDNGLLRYSGIRFVSDTGVFEKKIEIGKVKEFLASFEKFKLDTVHESYENRIVDLPGIFYEFKLGNDEMHVKNAQFGPNFLKSIATEIDNFVLVENGTIGDSTWKKTILKTN